MLGDGNIYINKNFSQISVTCNSEKESKYIITFLKPLVVELIGTIPKVVCRKFQNYFSQNKQDGISKFLNFLWSSSR